MASNSKIVGLAAGLSISAIILLSVALGFYVRRHRLRDEPYAQPSLLTQSGSNAGARSGRDIDFDTDAHPMQRDIAPRHDQDLEAAPPAYSEVGRPRGQKRSSSPIEIQYYLRRN